MKIKVHSFVDFMTNSSETVYVCVHSRTIDAIKDLINYFLKVAGSSKKADDLFEFRTELDEAYVERIFENIEELNELLLPEDAVRLFKAGLSLDQQYEVIRELVKEGKIDPDAYDLDNAYREDHVILVPKSNSQDVMDITRVLQNIFAIKVSDG